MSFQKDLAELETRLFPGNGDPCKNAKSLYKLAYNAAASYLEENKKIRSGAMHIKSKCNEYTIYNPKGWFEFTKYKVKYQELKKLDTINLLRLLPTTTTIKQILQLDIHHNLIASMKQMAKCSLKLLVSTNEETRISASIQNCSKSKIVSKIHEILDKIFPNLMTKKPWITPRYEMLTNENLWKITKLLSFKTAEQVIVDAFMNGTYEYSVFKINQDFAIEVVNKKYPK